MSAKKTINIAIVGVGLVGSEVLDQINDINIRNDLKCQLNVVFIARSDHFLMSKSHSPINLNTWRDLLAHTIQKSFEMSDLIEFLVDLSSKSSSSSSILIDNTSCSEIASSYPKLLKNGISIVTPNKKGISGPLELYRAIIDAQKLNARVYFEATVCAGLPIISTLFDLLWTGDKIHSIEGIFSGTCSFIFGEWSKIDKGDQNKFSEIVKKAQLEGYTEPDPRDDLNGLDVARKLIILARVCEIESIELETVQIESLIPKQLESAKSDEFLEQLNKFDASFSAKLVEAQNEDKILRYIASLDVLKKTAKVSIQKIERSHPFAQVEKGDNIVAFYTKRYQQRPLIIQGVGAGASVTAMGVLSDVFKVANRFCMQKP